MYIEGFTKLVGWDTVKRVCLRTVHKDATPKEPSSEWKHKLLLSEHSPIRALTFLWTWRDLMHWVQVHFVRHHEGIEKFVGTQRSDRTGIDRNKLPQDALQDMDVLANAQALINISKVRLCNCASKETREAWKAVKAEISKVEPELANCMVPTCVYRGFCPEMKSCGYSKTKEFRDALMKYRKHSADPYSLIPSDSDIERIIALYDKWQHQCFEDPLDFIKSNW